jgi:hypothetical protein
MKSMLLLFFFILAPGFWLLLLSHCCEAEARVVADAFDET